MGIFRKAFSIANTFSPVGLIGKLVEKEPILSSPSNEALKSGLGVSVVGAATAIGVGGAVDGLSDRREMNELQTPSKNHNMNQENTGGIFDRLKERANGIFGNTPSKPSGQIRFGSDSTQGFIPIILTVAIALAFAIGGGFLSFGKRK